MSEKSANPAPLGLLGFGMTTVLAMFVVNVRLGSVDGMILGMAIFYGGLAQIVAGIMAYKKGNTFQTTAFTSYGLFWLSYVAINWLGGGAGMTVAGRYVWPFFGGTSPWSVSHEALMAYFFMWGLFTFVMFFGTLKANRALQFVFMSLAILFFLLAVESALLAYTSITSDDLEPFTRFIGAEGVVCGFSAVYAGLAEVLSEVRGKTELPISPAS
jgi:succinate-acetate transporter protein